MANEDEEIYNNSRLCWVCKEELNTDKVRDYSTIRVNLEVLLIVSLIKF